MPTVRLRVLIAGLPPMLSDILMDAMLKDDEFDPQLAGGAETLAASITGWRPDALIAHDVAAAHLLGVPRLQVYLMGLDALDVHHLVLQPVLGEAGELSISGLLATIKQRAASA